MPPYKMTTIKMAATEQIEKCESLMVPKPNKGTRLCIVFRVLIEVAIQNSFLLVRMDDALHSIIMSTVDLH